VKNKDFFSICWYESFLSQELPDKILNGCVVACRNKLYLLKLGEASILCLKLDVDGAGWREANCSLGNWTDMKAIYCKG